MKTKEEVRVEGKPVFYAVLYTSMRKAALELGYALALHGSLHSDMDLIAVAWTEDAGTPEQLAASINDCIGKTVWSESNLQKSTPKPHGRIVYSLSIMGDWYIDLSIIPPPLVSEEKDIRIRELEEALGKIQRWELPSTGKFWDDSKTEPVSYTVQYGSNGARDFIRSIAEKALNPPKP